MLDFYNFVIFSTESIQDFYQRHSGSTIQSEVINNAGAWHFDVFRRETCSTKTSYSRGDFYKVFFITGTGKLHFADK